jgi:lipopolysaccharide/colanic/teichoic acid biosynthesis glycosyltransferase
MDTKFRAGEEEVVSIRFKDASVYRKESLLESVSTGEQPALDEGRFSRAISIERARTERSKTPFALMLLEAVSHDDSETSGTALECVMAALLSSSRSTDIIGWYKDGGIIGAIYTGLAEEDKNAALCAILDRVIATLRSELGLEQLNQVRVSFHYYPDDWKEDGTGRPSNPVLYPDLSRSEKGRRSMSVIKRAIDIVGSSMLLVVCGPFLLVIAAAIKASSKGPALFRQQRVGQYGRRFTLLKFRTMYVDNDHTVHREYVRKLINNEAERERPSYKENGVYKLTSDRRVTRIGKILRRTSMDELPQFLNVLRGEMSLVGPRPPIPYEVAAYQTWHRRRVLEVKPGITGLWQVTGRSRVKFDDMVRLDLRYATSWTPWLDFKILMRTPLAVIKGSGAY